MSRAASTIRALATAAAFAAFPAGLCVADDELAKKFMPHPPKPSREVLFEMRHGPWKEWQNGAARPAGNAEDAAVIANQPRRQVVGTFEQDQQRRAVRMQRAIRRQQVLSIYAGNDAASSAAVNAGERWGMQFVGHY